VGGPSSVTSVQCRREQYVAIRGKSRSGDISYIGICLGNKNQETRFHSSFVGRGLTRLLEGGTVAARSNGPLDGSGLYEVASAAQAQYGGSNSSRPC
jgi:hypothetical protein